MNESLLKADKLGRLRYTSEQKKTMVQAYRASGLSAPRFAAHHGVNYQTLVSWIKKDKNSSAPPASTPPKHFQELQCILQCDGYAVYPSWSKDKPWIQLMGCHSHVRRKFFEATDQSPRLVAWILRQLAHLYQIEKRLRETQAGPALRQAVRAAESSLIHRRLKKAIDKLALRRSILPKSKLGKAISYAIHYTIVENCRRLGINPKEYLTDVLTRLPGMLAKDAHTLTQVNWLKSRNGKPERMVA